MNVDLAKLAQIDKYLQDKEVAHLMIDRNRVISKNDILGLKVITKETESGVDVKIIVEEGVRIEKDVHLCFGVTHGKFVQNINMDVEVKDHAKISVLSHCIFPKGNVKHIMDATIRIGKNAEYRYMEKHIHPMEKNIEVYPKARVEVDEGGKFRTDFELIRGRVGILDIDYDVNAGKNSTVEMTTKASGIEDDVIKVKESAYLKGEKARGSLSSRIAVRDRAVAEVYNKMVATAQYARGHVDCKEIIQGNAKATAIPIVEVSHPKAHVTHEAAIGSVDTKQLQTLMARGLDEDEAVELIIQGLLEG